MDCLRYIHHHIEHDKVQDRASLKPDVCCIAGYNVDTGWRRVRFAQVTAHYHLQIYYQKVVV
jgi:hypothetical protein